MKKETGSLDIEYAKGREKNKALKYRLERRTSEVIKSIAKYISKSDNLNILDLGTADGKMLNKIQEQYSSSKCTGIEYSQDLVDIAKKSFPNLNIIQGDIQDLSILGNEKYDIVIATAVIEHVPNPQKVFNEVYARLNNNGVFILTAPDPLWEEIASRVGHLEEDQHFEVMNLKQLEKCSTNASFEIVKSEKFMFSPIGFPFEEGIEKILRILHLNFLMANQLLVSKKVIQ